MSASMNDDLRRLKQAKQAVHRPTVDEPPPDPKEQRNRAFRLQAFFALRYGFERGRRREAVARAKAEAAQNLQYALEQARAAARGNDAVLKGMVIAPPTITKLEITATELAKGQPVA